MYLGSITVESLDDKKVIVQSHVVKKKAGSCTLIVQQHHLIVRELMVGYLEIVVKKRWKWLVDTKGFGISYINHSRGDMMQVLKDLGGFKEVEGSLGNVHNM